MNTRVRINFSETSKEVKADITVECEGAGVNDEELLVRARTLFNEAQEFAHAKTLQKIKG